LAVPVGAERSRRPLTDADADTGKSIYVRECSSCHGELGDGAGPASEYLDPRPRDFTRERFRLRSTVSGVPPATADIVRTIARGIPGTAMPAFDVLARAEQQQVAAYVLKLGGLLHEPEPATVKIAAPPPANAGSVEKGKQIYADSGCPACHGVSGGGDGSSAAQLKDDRGRAIKARDFTRGVYRGGSTREDVYTRLVTGMDGTPMAEYREAIDPPELWALTDYVLSLRQPAMPLRTASEVIAKYGCRGCHILDDGSGGLVGPDLRASAQKLLPRWTREFLAAPRKFGHIYPANLWRMPNVKLSAEEVEIVTAYLAALGGRAPSPGSAPDTSRFGAEQILEGQRIFGSFCRPCHSFGSAGATATRNRQGPDLTHVAERIDYEWARTWLRKPQHFSFKTTNGTVSFTEEQTDAVQMFVWKTSDRATTARH